MRTGPKKTILILVETVDSEAVPDSAELMGTAVDILQPSSKATHIETTLCILRQAGDKVITQAGIVPVPVFQPGEIIGLQVEFIEPIDGADPKVLLFVLIDTPYIIIAEAGGI